MKKLNNLKYLFLLAAIFTLSGCDKSFVAKNQNPAAINTLDPGLLFTNAEFSVYPGSYEGEQTIVQQFLNAYNLGATTGFNFNTNNDNYNNPRWNSEYPNSIKLIEQIIFLIKSDPTHSNLYNMTRIWRAYNYMTLVDAYGDVPYSQAGKAFTGSVFNPAYDKSVDIYADIYNELHTATAALSTSNEYVGADLFFGGSSGNLSTQITEWKRLGYSLMLRLGMRYVKYDVTKAKTIAQEAFAGGVMQSVTDNVYLGFNATYNNQLNNGPRTVNPYYYYLADPFVTQLKTTKDPRLKYISGMYADPNTIATTIPDTLTADQFGFPVGYDQTTIKAKSDYRGGKGAGQNYSQLNYNVFGSASAPVFFITYAQTSLLLAEATFRGYITGGSTANQYYNAGVQASMDEYQKYPNATAIPLTAENSYLAQASVAYSAGNELAQINTQYWIASFGNGAEAFANFRRSGFPALSPNLYNNNLNGGFARRFAYPFNESSVNTANYQAAVASMGADNLTTRVFWDK